MEIIFEIDGNLAGNRQLAKFYFKRISSLNFDSTQLFLLGERGLGLPAFKDAAAALIGVEKFIFVK